MQIETRRDAAGGCSISGVFHCAINHDADLLARCGCDNDGGMGEVVQTIREAYNDESAIFKLS